MKVWTAAAGGLSAARCSMRLNMFSCAAQHSLPGNRMSEEAGDRRRCQAVRTMLNEGRQALHCLTSKGAFAQKTLCSTGYSDTAGSKAHRLVIMTAPNTSMLQACLL